MFYPIGNSYTEKVRSFTFLILVVILSLPLVPTALAYQHRDLDWNATFALQIASIGLMGLILGTFVLLLFWRHHKHQWSELCREIVFIFWHGKYACLIGSCLGIIAISFYLFLPFDSKNDEFAERVASGFGLYLGVVGSVLGIHTLYKKSAPITDVDLLLEYICNDLEEYTRPGNHLLIVYPALNIGFYRAIKHYGFVDEHSNNIPSDHPYSRFRRLLINAAGPMRKRATIVTYPKALYTALYEAYDSGKADPNVLRVKVCAEEATRFVETFSTDSGRSSHIEVHPHKCPPSVIVIGPVSYSILSYGLPKYREANEETMRPRFEVAEDSLATLLVYRREDATLSGLILREVSEELTRLGTDNL